MSNPADARWALRTVRAGRCCKCARPRNLYAWMCDDCHEAFLERTRRNAGRRAWEPGKAGRHPFKVTAALGLTRIGIRPCLSCRRRRTVYEPGVCLPCVLFLALPPTD